MAVTDASYTGNGSTTNYSFTFPYLKSTDVEVQVDATVTTAWTFANATTVQFNTAPANGAKIKILRQTNVDNLTATFYAGSAIKSEDLNDNFTQNLYSTQEKSNRAFETTGGTITGDIALGEDVTVKFEGATDNAHEITVTVADPTSDTTLTLPNTTGTVVTTGDTGTITATMLAANSVDSSELVDGSVDLSHMSANSVDSDQYVDGSIDHVHLANDVIDGDNIQDDVINSEHIAAGAVDLEHMSANSVDSDQYVNSSIDGIHISDDSIDSGHYVNSSIDGVHISDNSINSGHYIDGSIDREHLAADVIDGTKLADNAVNSEHITAGAVDLAHMSADSVDSDQYVNSSIDGIHISDDSIDSGHYVNSSIDGVHISDNSIDSGHYVDGSIDAAHLSANCVATSNIQNDAVTQSQLADNSVGGSQIINGAVDTNELATDAVESTKIADNAVTTAKIADAELTTLAGMQSATASVLAAGTDLTATIAELNTVCDGKGVHTTISDSDAHYPTSGAVVDYVAAQIAPIGGLEVIATDAAFPNTQPVAGVVISIADAGGLVVNGSGTSTTGRTVGGSTVTINNIASNFNSTTVDAGVCFQVSSTGSGQIYNYHKATLKEADLLNLSNDINDFAARYRVNAGEPSSNNDEGDLIYDTNANKMKVYDGSSWGEVTSTGDFKFLVPVDAGTTTAATWDGSDTSFDLKEATNSGSAASITSVYQLMVSVNGVIQKPNTGSWSGSGEGFYLTDSDTIRFATAPPTGSSVFIIQIGSAITPTTPADNTVSSIKIQNGAVTLDKMSSESVDEDNLKISNAGSNGQFLSKQSGNAGGLTWATVDLTAATDYADDVKIRFGTGNDLEIYHDGSHSYIDEVGTGGLKIRVAGTSNNGFYKYSSDEKLAIFIPDGAVELYYDNTKKFETTSTGVTLRGTEHKFEGTIRPNSATGSDIGTSSDRIRDLYVYNDIDIKDDGKLLLGDGDDLQIYHDGTNTYLDSITGSLKIRSLNGNMAVFTPDGAVELYYNEVKKFQTVSGGVRTAGNLELLDDHEIQLGSGTDFKIYHKSSDNGNYIECENSRTLYYQSDLHAMLDEAGNEYIIKGTANGAVELYYDNSKKLETYSSGVKTYGGYLRVVGDEGGVAQLDLYADEGDDAYDIWQVKAGGSSDFYINGHNGSAYETALKATGNGSVELYYDNAKKLETVTGGATITGTCTATAFAGDGSALTGIVSFVTGMIIIWSGASNAIPSGWVICDGNNSTPDLRNRFIVGAGDSYSVGATGGATTDTVTISDSDTVNISISGSGTTGGENLSIGNRVSSGNLNKNHTHDFSFSGSGSDTVNISGSDTVNTVPPYYALCYIMKS